MNSSHETLISSLLRKNLFPCIFHHVLLLSHWRSLISEYFLFLFITVRTIWCIISSASEDFTKRINEKKIPKPLYFVLELLSLTATLQSDRKVNMLLLACGPSNSTAVSKCIWLWITVCTPIGCRHYAWLFICIKLNLTMIYCQWPLIFGFTKNWMETIAWAVFTPRTITRNKEPFL